MPSPFDLTNFLADEYRGDIDTKWHNIDDNWEGMGQLKDFEDGRAMDPDKFNGRSVIACRAIWVLNDEDMRQRLGMTELRITQDLLIDLDGNNKVDWGINKNMVLKSLIEAFGLAHVKARSLNMLKNQVAWLYTRNEPDKTPGADPERKFSRVKRVVNLELGRAAFEAKRAAEAA